MRSAGLVALAASLSSVAAVYQGFNYGSTNSDGSPKTLDQFTAEFTTAKNLVGASGFTSARLYTSIQGGSSTNEPIQAIKAGIQTGTSLLLGVWASGGQDGINAELIALKSAMSQFGLTAAHVAGLSVGSEDLYRISPTGIAAKSGYGADPSVLVSYIAQIRAALQGTALAGVPIGHVDTWTAWVNGSNSAVIDAVDFIGVDAYPYFQNTQSNGIENGASLFNDAYSATVAMAKGKDVWITETGFPVSGPTENLAVPSIANAKTYWDQVGCPRFGKVNTYWYTLFDAPSAPSFGIVGNTLSTTPLFDLSCSAASSSSSSSAAATSSSSSAAATSSTSSAVAASSASSVIAASSSTSSAASSSLAIVVPPLSTVATGSSTSVKATTVPSLVSSGGGLGPTISPPIVSTAIVVTPTSQGASTTAAPTTITTIVGAGNGTATTRASVSTTSSASIVSTAAASFATVPAIGGALGAVLAFMAAM